MPSPVTLASFVADEPTNFAELTTACRNIIDAWLAAGGEPTDDIVIGIYGIDSQVDEVGMCGRERAEDEADFYRVFYPAFIAERDAIRRLLAAQSA